MAKKENKRGLLSGILNFVGGPDNDFAENPAQYNNDNDYQFVKSVAFNGWSWDGKNTVNEETILTIPAVKSALDIITQTVGTLPIVLYKMDNNNAPQEVKGDSRVTMLNSDTNDVLTGTAYKQKITKDLVLYGQSVTMMERPGQNSNKVTGLYPLDTERLLVNVYTANGYKYYPQFQYNALNQSYLMNLDNAINMVSNSDDGVTGQGVIQSGADILQLALSQYQYEYNLLNNGAMPSGILKFQQKMNKDVLDAAKQRFESAYSGYANQGKIVTLEGGADYQQVQIDPDKLQLDISKTDMLGQIARLFNIPETMINAKANKYNSNEQNNIQFFQFTLKPILDSISSAFNKYLLLEKEKKLGYYFDFNTDSIFLNTLDEKAQSYTQLFNNGVMTFNEVRNKLGLNNSAVGDDFMKYSLGNVLVDQKTGQATVFNTMTQDMHSGIDNSKPGSNPADQLSAPKTDSQPSNGNGEQSAKAQSQKNTSKSSSKKSKTK
ncbi:MAG: hypothetical protein [Caudoviricetes sp.]|nr:MAG: hypothetical protein [Caudoviricetes sp.]